MVALRSANDILISRSSRISREYPALVQGMNVGIVLGIALYMIGTRCKVRALAIRGMGVGSACLVGRISVAGNQGPQGSHPITRDRLATDGHGRIWPTNCVPGTFYELIYGGAVDQDLVRLSKGLNKTIEDARKLAAMHRRFYEGLVRGEDCWWEFSEVGRQLLLDYRAIQRWVWCDIPLERWEQLSAVLVEAGGEPLPEDGMRVLFATLPLARDYHICEKVRRATGRQIPFSRLLYPQEKVPAWVGTASFGIELVSMGLAPRYGQYVSSLASGALKASFSEPDEEIDAWLRRVHASSDLSVIDIHRALSVFCDHDIHRLAALEYRVDKTRKLSVVDFHRALSVVCDHDIHRLAALEHRLRKRFLEFDNFGGASIFGREAPVDRSVVPEELFGREGIEVVLGSPNIAALFADQGGLPNGSHLKGELHAKGFVVRSCFRKAVDCDDAALAQKIREAVHQIDLPSKLWSGNLVELVGVRGSGDKLVILWPPLIGRGNRLVQQKALLSLEEFVCRCLGVNGGLQLMKEKLATGTLAEELRDQLMSKYVPEYLTRSRAQIDRAIRSIRYPERDRVTSEKVKLLLKRAGAIAQKPDRFFQTLSTDLEK